MIVYDLSCDIGHRFEGWFGNSTDFASQQERGLVSCPECGSPNVSKAPMAPSVPAKANTRAEKAPDSVQEGQHPVSNKPMPEEVQKALSVLAEAQSKALRQSTWVGDKFAEQSRAMHYGEQDEKPIHGQASAEEAKSLLDEGISVAPLPFPVSPPDELN